MQFGETRQATMNDERSTELVQAVADAIEAATDEGMDLHQALSLASIAVTEFGRVAFGEDYIEQFCETIRMRRGQPLPGNNLDEISN